MGWADVCFIGIYVSSCGSGSTPEEQVKQFAADFAAKVSKNQKDSLTAVWPDVAKADSLALTFNADSIGVEATQTPGQYKVNFGDANMLVTLAEDGKITIGETYGLFAWPEEKVGIGLATGWITKELNDLQKQERFADTLFINNLADNLMAGLKSKLRATCKNVSTNYTTGVAKYAIAVQNGNEFDIPADAYGFILKEWGWDSELLRDVAGPSKALNGVEVKAKSSATCPVPGNYDYEYSSLSVAVKIKYNKEQALKNLFQPTGNEYEEYLKTKKN